MSEPKNEWKEVIIEALIVDCIYQKEHETDPRKALFDLIAWEQKIALDPAVSKEARDLLYQTPPAPEPKPEPVKDAGMDPSGWWQA